MRYAITIAAALSILCTNAWPKVHREDLPSTAVRYYTDGLLAEIEGDLDRALGSYLIAESIAPDEPELLFNIAEIYLRQGEAEQASKRFEQLVALEPDEERYRRGAGETAFLIRDYKRAAGHFRWIIDNGRPGFYVRFRYASTLLSLGKRSKALVELECLVEDFPKRPEPAALAGSIHMAAMDYEKAAGMFRIAVGADPSSKKAYLGLAAAFDGMEMPDSAAEAYGRYVRLNPDDRQAFVRWFGELLEREEFENALESSRIYLESSPDDRDILRQSAFLAFYMEEYSTSVEYFERLLERDPGDREARAYYGRSLLAVGEIAGSIDQFKIVLDHKRDPEAIIDLALALSAAEDTEKAERILRSGEMEFPLDADIPFHRGLIHSKAGEYAEAKLHLYRAVELDPNHLDALFALGDALERTGERDSAIAIFTILTNERPGEALEANYLAYLLVETGRELERADSLLDIALTADPDNPAYIDSYGWLLYKRGEYDDALKKLLRAEKLAEPSDPVIFEHIGIVYEKVGDIPSAVNYYRKAIELDPSLKTSRSKLESLE